MEKETFIWSEDGVKVTSTTKVANGIQETTIRLDDGKDFLLVVFRLVFHHLYRALRGSGRAGSKAVS